MTILPEGAVRIPATITISERTYLLAPTLEGTAPNYYAAIRVPLDNPNQVIRIIVLNRDEVES